MRSLTFVPSPYDVLILVANAYARTPQYRDPDMVQKVKDVAGNKITHVFDTITGNDTQFTAVKVLEEGKPGKVVIVLPHAEGVQDVRKDVQVKSSSYLPPLLNRPLDYTH